MDEVLSPLLGSLRAIRRSISSSVFNPIQRPVGQAPQVDPATTNLISQNSLVLSSVSQKLDGISQQMQSLNSSLIGIKENLAVSETLEKRRESAKQNRERILAEQGLRQGKEDALEKNIQNSLTAPVQRISGKTRGALSSLTSFFGFLTAGWLTKTSIDLLKARSDGNTERFEQLKTNLTRGLVAIGATLTALSLGVGKNLFFTLSKLGTTLSRAALGGVLAFKIEILRQALVRLFNLDGPKTQKEKGRQNIITAIIAGFGLLADRLVGLFNRNVSGVATGLFEQIGNFLKKQFTKFGIGGPVITTTGGKTLQSVLGRILGFLKNNFAFAFANFVYNLTVLQKSAVEAFQDLATFLASLSFARYVLRRFKPPKGASNSIWYTLTLFAIASYADSTFKNIIDDFLGGRKPEERAMGGPVNEGETYLVGERGPELFTPDRSGRIIANDMIEAMKTDQTQLRSAIASLDENNLPPNILTFPIASTGSGATINTPPSRMMASNVIPEILFNENNIHNVHALAMYGVNV